MNDKEREVKKQEVLHEFVKGHEKDVGSVDAGEVAAATMLLKRRMGEAGIDTTSPRELSEMTRAALSDTGADPTLAGRQVKERMNYEKRQKSYDRRRRRRPPRRRR